MEQRLIEEMAKLRGGKTRLKKLLEEYQKEMLEVSTRFSRLESLIQNIELLTKDAPEEEEANEE